MVNSRFDPKEVNSERTVIINERQGNENSPGFRLSEDVQATAFKAHSVRPRSDRPHVRPGDDDARRLCTATTARTTRRTTPSWRSPATSTRVRCWPRSTKRYGKLKPSAAHRSIGHDRAGAEGRAPRDGEGRRRDTTTLRWPSMRPTPRTKTICPLVALDSVLCGASGLSFFGGGTSNRSSRLSKALVDTGYAADAGGGVLPTVDPFLYSLGATVMPGKDINDVERSCGTEIERVQRRADHSGRTGQGAQADPRAVRLRHARASPTRRSGSDSARCLPTTPGSRASSTGWRR